MREEDLVSNFAFSYKSFKVPSRDGWNIAQEKNFCRFEIKLFASEVTKMILLITETLSAKREASLIYFGNGEVEGLLPRLPKR